MPKVLVVDDSVSVRKVVERALAAKGIDVLAAASGQEAVEHIGREQPDLVVCDVIMPDMDGYQICSFMKTHPQLGRIPVLLISGIVNSSVLERAAAVRADEVMGKPFNAEDLARTVARLLAMSPAAAIAAPGGDAGPAPDAASEDRPLLAAAVADTLAALAEPSVPAPTPAGLDDGLEDTPVAATLGPGLDRALAKLAGIAGVALVAIVDREGFLIESAGELELEAEVTGALASCLGEFSDGIGRELRQGKFQSMILEYESGLVLLGEVDAATLLAVVVHNTSVLGKVRYYMKKLLPELRAGLGTASPAS